MKIRYINTWDFDKNIGKGINEVISEMPDDCYIVLRDGDTLFLTPDWGDKIRQIITDNPSYDLISCDTNRLNVPAQLPYGMDNETDIQVHIARAHDLWAKNGTKVEQAELIGGLLMIFHKSLWHEFKFTEDILKAIRFDQIFCEHLKGRKIGIAKGLYTFHIYRIWSKFMAQFDKSHLMPNILK